MNEAATPPGQELAIAEMQARIVELEKQLGEAEDALAGFWMVMTYLANRLPSVRGS
jgi:hypothetical protein